MVFLCLIFYFRAFLKSSQYMKNHVMYHISPLFEILQRVPISSISSSFPGPLVVFSPPCLSDLVSYYSPNNTGLLGHLPDGPDRPLALDLALAIFSDKSALPPYLLPCLLKCHFSVNLVLLLQSKYLTYPFSHDADHLFSLHYFLLFWR